MNRIMVFVLLTVLYAFVASAQEPYPYRALDPRQFDPAVETLTSICLLITGAIQCPV